MRSLNECLGDGRAIAVRYDDSSVLDSLSELSKDELKKAKEKKMENAAIECAKQVSQRFSGKTFMGTSIHSRLPSLQRHLTFVFDEEYMQKCCTNASSASNLELCAGSAYFNFVHKFFHSHYYLYDNGCEGIRNGCIEQGKQMCQFHQNIENKALLSNCWRGESVQRVPPPVPDYSETSSFHYCTLQQTWNGDVCEKFGVKKDIVKDATKRELNDFCPRKQLEKLFESCGEPDLQLKEFTHEDGSVSVSCIDNNKMLQTLDEQLDSFVEKFVGEDLRKTTENEMRRRYNLKVKSEIIKKSKASVKAVEKAKSYQDIDWEKHISENSLDKLYVSQLNLYLVQHLNMTRAECDKKGYTKEKKIQDIKANFFGRQLNSSSKKQNNGPTLISLQGTTHSHPSSKITSQPPSANSSTLHVPPWGGTLNNTAHMVTQSLTNTCPIDNYLTIFYVLLTDHKKLHQELVKSTEIFAGTLIHIKNLFDTRMFPEAKLEWLHLFPARFDLTAPIIDLWGNEDDLFLSRLQPVLRTTHTGTCSSPACPAQQVDYVSHNVMLRYLPATFYAFMHGF